MKRSICVSIIAVLVNFVFTSATRAQSAPAKALPEAPAKAAGAPKESAAPARPLSPQEKAAEIGARIPMVKRALHEVRVLAGEIKDPPLRSAVQAQLEAPWLPRDAWALAHKEEAEKKLRAAGLLAADAPLILPAAGSGSLASAPGGPCATGHHGYPGGLAVHEDANALHARALAQVYGSVYGVSLNDDWLIAAALWHDTMKAGTLPWDANGDCPHSEPQLAGTAAHHPLGVAAAILRHLPAPVILVIASSHFPPAQSSLPQLCATLRAAGIVAVGDENRVPCPTLEENSPRPPIEAFVNNSADSDYALTVAAWSWYSAQTPAGWERFSALEADGSDLAAFQRAGIK